MKEHFIKAVEDGNVGKVRIALSNELLLDPRGKTFAEMLIYAKEKLPNLFEENKEANYNVPPKEDWNEAFLFKVKNDLDSNFSVEKLAFYQAVIEVVGKEKAETLEKEEQQSSSKPASDTMLVTRKKSKVKPTSITVTTGGAILTAAGICFGKTLLTIFGGTVLIEGVLLILNDIRK